MIPEPPQAILSQSAGFPEPFPATLLQEFPLPSATLLWEFPLPHLKRSSPARPLVAASSGNSSSGGFPSWAEYSFRESTSSARLPVTPSSMNPRDQQMNPGAPLSAGCRENRSEEETPPCPTFQALLPLQAHRPR